MEHKLYNAGDRIKELMLYSVKAADKDLNWIARKEIDLPEHGFSAISDEIALPNSGQRIPVNFHLDLPMRHGHRGLVLINKEMATDVDDDTPYARDEKDARAKGDRLWRNHLINTVQRHVDLCAALRASGAAPKAASNFTLRAFRLLGLKDPAELIFQSTVVQADDTKPLAVPEKNEKK